MEFWGEPAVEVNTLQSLSYRKLKVHNCFFFLSVFFRDVDCWTVVGGGSFLQGRFRVRAGVKSKCVIVTELMRKSRGGQCADRTLGCMIHRRGLNTNPLEPPTSPPSPPPPLLLKSPPSAYIIGLKPKWWWVTSCHLLCGRLQPYRVNWHPNLWTTSKQN